MQLVHPVALVGLARVLQAGNPKMSAEMAVNNSNQIIKGLHKLGLQVGPLAAFGPQAAVADQPFDGLNLIADMIEHEQGRKPWLPE